MSAAGVPAEGGAAGDVRRTANLLGALALALSARAESEAAARSEAERSLRDGVVAIANFGEGRPLGVLQEGLGLSQPGAVRLMDRLERAGLARRERGDDGREARPRLTAAGRRLARQTVAARLDAIAAPLAALAPCRRHELERTLAAMLAALTTDAAESRRLCRLCDADVCGHPARCPVTQAALQGGAPES